MKYDFDKIIDRKNDYSSKWNDIQKMFGRDDLLPMWVGDMDFESPQPVIDALVERAKKGVYGYTSTPPSYFESVAQWMKKRHNWNVETDWMVYTPGVVTALSFIINAFTNPGDKVIVQQPVYYPFFRVIEENGRRLVNNPLVYKDGKYTIDFNDLEEKAKDRRIKLMFLCNPHNPVGRVWTKEELTMLGKICIENNILVVSDEIHQDIVYPGSTHVPFASISEEFALSSITCTSPSKTFNLAGLQTATIIIPNTVYYDIYKNFLKRLELMNNHIFGMVAQEAAYSCGEEWLNQLLEYLAGNLKLLIDEIEREIPQLKAIRPEGTFFVWLDCTSLGLDPHQLSDFMTNKAKLALESGYWFGTGGEGFERINIACPRVYIAEAVKRLKTAIREIK